MQVKRGDPTIKSPRLEWALLILTATQVAIFLIVFAQTVMLVPFSDMIAWLDRYATFKRDGDLLHYLFAPHNEHRLVTIRLLTMCDVELFGGRGIAFIIAAVSSLAGILALTWRELRRAGEPAFGSATALAAALILTVPTAVDCSVPINSLYPITVFFVFLAIASIDDTRPDRTPRAILSAAAASLTNAIGLVVWPILLLQAYNAKINWPWLALMFVLMFIFCGMFVIDQQHSSATAARSIVDAVRYWPSFVGLPWSRSTLLEIPAGIGGSTMVIAAIVFSVSLLTRIGRLETIALAFMLFSLGCSIFAAFGRSGLHEPFPPVRYAIFLMPLHLALLFFVLERKWLSQRIALVVLLALLTQQSLAGYMAVHTARSLGVPVGF